MSWKKYNHKKPEISAYTDLLEYDFEVQEAMECSYYDEYGYSDWEDAYADYESNDDMRGIEAYLSPDMIDIWKEVDAFKMTHDGHAYYTYHNDISLSCYDLGFEFIIKKGYSIFKEPLYEISIARGKIISHVENIWNNSLNSFEEVEIPGIMDWTYADEMDEECKNQLTFDDVIKCLHETANSQNRLKKRWLITHISDREDAPD